MTIKTGFYDPKTHYAFLRDATNRPVITLCMFDLAGVKGYGWAICSPRDNPNKRKGKGIAIERAWHAFDRAVDMDLQSNFYERRILRSEACGVIDALSVSEREKYMRFFNETLFTKKNME